MEFKTFRMRGHEEASGKICSSKLMDLWAVKDPVENYRSF
jgi:2-oxoisovalerate dehydrogenase E1 component